MQVAVGLGSGPLVRTPEEMAAELYRRTATHGLSLLCIAFGSLDHTRQLGEQVLSLVRTG